ncbi:unnamed protein product [Leuciscus chuanchicus]
MDEEIDTRKINNSFLRDHNYATEVLVFQVQPVQTVDYIDSIKAFFFSDNRQLKSFTEPDPLVHRQEAFNRTGATHQ